MHVISAVVWVGGLIFLNVVMNPVLEHEQGIRTASTMAIQKRFFGFVWMSLWIMLATGALLMLVSPQFRWFDYSTPWRKLMAVKELSFLLMVFFTVNLIKEVFQ